MRALNSCLNELFQNYSLFKDKNSKKNILSLKDPFPIWKMLLCFLGARSISARWASSAPAITFNIVQITMKTLIKILRIISIIVATIMLTIMIIHIAWVLNWNNNMKVKFWQKRLGIIKEKMKLRLEFWRQSFDYSKRSNQNSFQK